MDSCSEEAEHRQNLHVQEWGLVYSPINNELAELMNETVALLKLENGTVAVNNSADIEAVMFNREFVAGVEFDIPAVSIIKLVSFQVKATKNQLTKTFSIHRMIQTSLCPRSYHINCDFRVKVEHPD